MTRLHTLGEAQALLPEARRRVAEAADSLARLQALVRRRHETGAVPGADGDEITRLEEEVDAALRWFEANGIAVKSLAPALLDFPARAVRDGQPIDVLLCWRDDEEAIAYYHPPEGGYRLREPVALLDDV